MDRRVLLCLDLLRFLIINVMMMKGSSKLFYLEKKQDEFLLLLESS